MRLAVKEHVHKYERKNLSRNKRDPFLVLKCQVAGCTHYINLEVAEGRLSECWRCGDTFVLDKKALDLKKPHCKNCTRTKTKTTQINEAALDALARMLGGGNS